MAKVIVINGSPRADQCTATALNEMIKTFNEEGVETELIHIGNKAVRGCAACGYCESHDGCVFRDIVNEVSAKLEKADGLVVGSPVYYGSPNGTLISFLDRLFYSAQYDMHMKRKTRRKYRIFRCAQQVLQHKRHADRNQHILEPGTRIQRR